VAEFAAAATRLAGIAGVLLGWRPDEFWTATPAELATVLSTMTGVEEAPASMADLERLMEMFPDG
jgi:uncharacterized phage protein (TIGR02216 family)